MSLSERSPTFALAYKASVDSLSFKIILITAVITPIFFVVFFLLVRAQSIPPEMIPRTVLTALYLMPVATSTFYLSSSFGRLKNWGVLRHIMLSPRGLIAYGMYQCIPATIISFFAIFSVSLVTDIFLPTLSLLERLPEYALLTMLLSISAMLFGLLCALLILPLRDYLIVTNSLFFLVILSSGIIFPLPDGLKFIQYVTPIGAPASGLSALLSGEDITFFVLISLFASLAYIALSLVIAKWTARAMKLYGFGF